jgi:AbrB family looped-hinge helix DNA binding protein
MQTMKMSEGGRVVIPQEIRQALGVKEGDSLLIEFVDGEARISTRATLADELIAERRAAAEDGD